MLLKLLPEQIAGYWDYIKYGLENSVPGDILRSGNRLNNILESLLSDGMQCWWWVREADGQEPQVVCQIITTIFSDESSRSKTLRIYSLFGYADLSYKDIKGGMLTLIRYAKSRGCEELDAHTEAEEVADLAKRFGFEHRFYYLTRRI